MTAPHRIRLQGPWQVHGPCPQDLLESGMPAEVMEVHLPAPWSELFGNVAGTARFQRPFNRPTNLTAEDRVRVRLPEQCGNVLRCTLNEQVLEQVSEETGVYEATEQLQDFNLLEIQIEFDPAISPQTGGIWKPVLLEIHSADAT